MFKRRVMFPEARELGRDLLNIEINTVEKENMSARKMPIFPHALIDIAECYLHKMVKLRIDMPTYWELDAKQRKSDHIKLLKADLHPELLRVRLCTGQETFDKLRWAAAQAVWDDIARPEENQIYSDSDRVVLDRIRRNCDQIKNMIRDLTAPDHDKEAMIWQEWLNDDISRLDLISNKFSDKAIGNLPVDYAISIRKIWDVGVEHVMMQTIVQLDGDVITRIQAGLDDKIRDRLLHIHGKGVDTALDHWKTLLDVVKELVGSLTDLFMPSRH